MMIHFFHATVWRKVFAPGENGWIDAVLRTSTGSEHTHPHMHIHVVTTVGTL